MSTTSQSVAECIEWFKQGGGVLVADSPDRENEVDIVISAEHATEAQITEMINMGTGIICVTMTKEHAIKNNLVPMTTKNTDPKSTHFTISCDSVDCTTGVSASDRLRTVKALLNSGKITKPGHVFPLVAADGLLNEREGHTEASVALCKLAGLEPVAVIVEVMKEDGTMMRVCDISEDLLKKFKFCTIEEIKNKFTVAHPSKSDHKALEYLLTKCKFASDSVQGELVAFKNRYTQQEQIALFMPSLNNVLQQPEMLVRFHSECCTGNVFGSKSCDCNEQLHKSIDFITRQPGGGCVFYVLGHEGRGIGLFNKIQAYSVQQTHGKNTYTANTMLGFKEDERDYSEIIRICKQLGVESMKIITNNPDKLNEFSKWFQCTSVGLESTVNSWNKTYLETKTEYGKAKVSEMSARSHKGFDPEVVSVTGKRVCIISTCWNIEYVSKMVDACAEELVRTGNIPEFIKVPGSWELPYAIINRIHKYDAIVAIGVLIKGETKHFEYIAKNVFNGMMQAQLTPGACPVINGVLTVLHESQIQERLSLAKGWAQSALMMLREP